MLDRLRRVAHTLAIAPSDAEIMAARNKRLPLRKFRAPEWTLVARLAATNFTSNDLATRASAITFTFILSLVPLLAIAFTFFNIFGGLQILVDKTVKPIIARHFLSDASVQLNGFVDLFVKNLETGTLGAVSFVSFFVTIVLLLLSIERSFNLVFEAPRERSLFRRITNYWILMSLTPLVIVFSTAKSTDLLNQFSFVSDLLSRFGVLNVLRIVVGNSVQVLGFAFLFMVLPNRRVSLRAVLLASIVASVLFNLLSYLNLFLSSNLVSNSTASTVYGSIPLLAIIFFAWIRYVWVITLIAACLCAAMGKILESPLATKGHFPSPAGAVLRCCSVYEFIVREYLDHTRATNQHKVARSLAVPRSELEEYVHWLMAGGLVFDCDETREERLLPTREGLRVVAEPDAFLRALFTSSDLGHARYEDASLSAEVFSRLAQLQLIRSGNTENRG